MVSIRATDREGRLHLVGGSRGVAMRALRDRGGFDIEAECGGLAECGTCHVLVAADWFDRLPEAEDIERELLEGLLHCSPCSRLACQVQIEERLEGLAMTLAPKE